MNNKIYIVQEADLTQYERTAQRIDWKHVEQNKVVMGQ